MHRAIEGRAAIALQSSQALPTASVVAVPVSQVLLETTFNNRIPLLALQIIARFFSISYFVLILVCIIRLPVVR